LRNSVLSFLCTFIKQGAFPVSTETQTNRVGLIIMLISWFILFLQQGADFPGSVQKLKDRSSGNTV
ncbi:hypothetical protein, partial [Enterobacter cloacae complex sp. 2DZ2F20B]|uniref:hypothetical protein n=1 Tax=Enterobacter cloacae complex sp. 2DZ2F20B TaxID=2511993 RepID=UPI001CA4DA0B